MKNIKFLAIFILGAILRIACFWTQPLWYDENFSLILSRLPIREMFTATMGDVHPPLWYLVIWPLGQIHDAPAWIIRIPSLIFSLLGLWLTWLIVCRMTPHILIRYGAFLLMAIAPIQIYYAQEGRMYALLQLCILTAWWSILNRRWWLVTISLTAMLYTQNVGVIYYVCLLAAGLLYHKLFHRYTLRNILISFGIAGLLWVAWVPVIINQMAMIHGNHWIPPVTVGDALYHYAQMFWLANMAVRLEIVCVVVFFTWVFYSVWYLLKYYRWIQCFDGDRFGYSLLVLAFGPWALEIILSLIYQPILLHRTLIGVTPFLYIILAVSFIRFTRERYIKFITLAIFIPLMISWYTIYYLAINNPALTEYNTIIAEIEPNWKPGDIVYLESDNAIVDILPYFDNADRIYKLPDCSQVTGGLTDQTRSAMGFQIRYLEDIDYSRIWLVTHDTPFNPDCEREYLNNYVEDLTPVKCVSAAFIIQSCLYLVTP